MITELQINWVPNFQKSAAIKLNFIFDISISLFKIATVLTKFVPDSLKQKEERNGVEVMTKLENVYK